MPAKNSQKEMELIMRKVLLTKCDRCGANHGVKIVRPFESLSGWWFTICPLRQEPVYVTEQDVA